MKWLVTTGCMAFVTVASAAPLYQRDATGPDEASVAVSEEPLHILDTARAQSCSAKAGICFSPGARTTVQAESAPVVAARSNAATPPRFQRAAAVAAASSGAARVETNLAWTLDVAAQLKRPAVAGNTLFVFFDMADPDALKENATTALYQAPVKAGKSVAAHLSLSPEEGFRAGHTYRLRIVQLLGGREVVLQESDFTLL